MIIAVLVFAFWWGGDAPSLRGWNVEPTPKVTERVIIDEVYDNDESPTPTVEPTISPTSSPVAENSEKIQNKPTADKPMTAEEKIELAEEIAGEPYEEIYTPDLEYSENNGMNIDESTGTDEYKTEPVPEGKPVPVEPQDAVIENKELTCTLSVRCDTILDNMSWLDKEKWELVPSDGVIFKEQTVEFYDGESVFDLLQREMKNNKIHMEFENTPMYNSAYIEGIGNLYEFDCGELSGWMYKVNDWFPNYGCSRYQLKQGDKVEWVYTCNLGIDVGGIVAIAAFMKKKGKKIESFLDLNIGDYVVHENSGVGRYTGIEQITVNNIKKDYMKLVYQGGDNLYVPIDQMDKVQKYIGVGEDKVKLNKLGTNEWTRAKAKVKKEIEDMTKELIELYAKREKDTAASGNAGKE